LSESTIRSDNEEVGIRLIPELKVHGPGNGRDVERESVLTTFDVKNRPWDSIDKDVISIEVISVNAKGVIKQLIFGIEGSISNDERKTIRTTWESILHFRTTVINPVLRSQSSVSIVGSFVNSMVVVPTDASSVVGVHKVLTATGEENRVSPTIIRGKTARTVQVDLDRPRVGVINAAHIGTRTSVSSISWVLNAQQAVTIIGTFQHVLEADHGHDTLADTDGGTRDGSCSGGRELVREEFRGSSRDEHLDVLIDSVDLVVFDLPALVLRSVREGGADGLGERLRGVLPRGNPWLHRLGAPRKASRS